MSEALIPLLVFVLIGLLFKIISVVRCKYRTQ